MQRTFWLSFMAAAAIYLTMVLWAIPYIMGQANGQLPFDMRPFGYTLAEAKAFVGALSPEGRAFYLTTQQRLDVLYPTLLGLSLILGLQMTLRAPMSTIFGVIALMATAADYFENYLVAGLLQTPPDQIDLATVNVASFLTMSKSLGHTACFLALLIGVSIRLTRKLVR